MRKLVLLTVCCLFSNLAFAIDIKTLNKQYEVIGPALECRYLYMMAEQPQDVQRMTILAYDKIKSMTPIILNELKKELAKERKSIPKHPAFDFDNHNYWVGRMTGRFEAESDERMRKLIFGQPLDYQTMAMIKISEKNCDYIR